jgi:uncharacterized protein
VIAYLDASVVMRIVLRADDPLPESRRIDTALSSAVLTVECFRTLHRVRESGLSDAAFAEGVEDLNKALQDVVLVDVSRTVLERAAGSFPSPVKTLDAIHLATAMLWREREDPALAFATHDRQLGLAARAAGFTVLGL